jgi:hypothetical protein
VFPSGNNGGAGLSCSAFFVKGPLITQIFLIMPSVICVAIYRANLCNLWLKMAIIGIMFTPWGAWIHGLYQVWSFARSKTA